MSETPQLPTGQDAGGTQESGASSSGYLNRTDTVIALIVLGVCLLGWYHTTTWEKPMAAFTSVVPPTWFPQLVLGCIMALVIFLPLEQHLKGKNGAVLDDDRRDRIKPITYVTTVVTVTIAASMAWMGTLVTVVLICIVLPVMWGERRWKILGPFIVLFPILVFLLFKVLFSVNFEPGMIGLGIQ
ncbi:MAG: tripartite tricarboxylate transporter TctB family protein [Rhodospirillaceae bacterium]|nr:tripartite tricarboxylate transporter TctB family protein [Rhodospirillales bacterium]MBT3905708.1 tripartite tricarboxylate transporter TctB family protein [Rhodospirillaceae bacterium]MBT4699941.1 tripartite tricarboxylate transporter TctB family protein [Rhodospirillaceae bacterium]MBT5034299.1 tripartite tricarboxylate transporter TctB family protein [Rhodospirillaceae bacterium]MBT6221695.1 tripartite tricarboxylate transporter TctB family protein [Rhodospirillaceae bacterium]